MSRPLESPKLVFTAHQFPYNLPGNHLKLPLNLPEITPQNKYGGVLHPYPLHPHGHYIPALQTLITINRMGRMN
jgi:hypothetical protein